MQAQTIMNDETKTPLTQPVDDDVRKLARHLSRSARFGALSVLRPEDGFPSVSRVLSATDFIGRPVLLISGLSLHSRALAADTRCSLLLGEPAKGDPLAHPRLSICANARLVEPQSNDRQELRTRFLARHPKAELYVDFPDFRFVVLEPVEASLNGGFARAYDLKADDLVDDRLAELEMAAIRAVDHMNTDHSDAVDRIASNNGEGQTGWRIATADRWGFEIARSDRLIRIEFRSDPAAGGGYRQAFVELVSS
ncbi:hypothetical protein FP2506_06611 [Fulvimarina pelagi HTCC2506]|uniref:DUF2470 domain-containing protein n=2 Tax=Fulvimarina pelagi TaxID=217511 RepID=Q0G774_9HYPH|nr:hypothetical protein FP2506_06611 [Fulvimarina pelagi HTCC2506]